MSRPAPVTTDELILRAMDETGLGRAACLQIVAKSAAIRALARRYGPRFVLKGGTLLYHVYNSRRASYKDADFAEPKARYAKTDELVKVLTIQEGSFRLRADEGTWRYGEDMIEGLEIPVDIGNIKKVQGQRDLKITVSLRESEHLDPPPAPLLYTDQMLAEESTFKVNGLTLDELSAEKIIGWSLRGAQKHYADLGLLARDHALSIDRSHVKELVRRKVQTERTSTATKGFYYALGIKRPSDLALRFRAPANNRHLHKLNWEAVVGTDFHFMADEEDRDQPFSDVANVKVAVETYWGPVLDALTRRR